MIRQGGEHAAEGPWARLWIREFFPQEVMMGEDKKVKGYWEVGVSGRRRML